MGKTKKHNQGFSLIELLIALTILSIVMIMVVQFMSTSTAAYQKNKKNLSIQTEAMQVLEQMSDTLMQAKYVRVATKDKGTYTIVKDDVGNENTRVITQQTDTVQYDFVPDGYGNYAKKSDFTTTDRKAIVNFSTYQIVDETNNPYPLSGDKEELIGSGGAVVDVGYRSFRALKPVNDFYYVKPEFIYAEYVKDEGKTVHVIYHITDITDTRNKTCSIYVYRYETDDSDPDAAGSKNYFYAKNQILGLLGKGSDTNRDDANAAAFVSVEEADAVLQKIDVGVDGLLTDKISDFYLSADSEGNAFLTNIMFKDGNYQYNTAETIKFRNSNVLTVRPQKLYKFVPNSSGGTVTPGGAGGTTEAGGTGGTTEAGGAGGTTEAGGTTTP